MLSNSRFSASASAPAAGRFDALVAAALLALCAVVVAVLAWTQPDRSTLVLSFAQHGQLSYSAPTGPSSPYGAGGLRSGQPVYADVVPKLNVGYTYAVSASSPVSLTGAEQLTATVSDGLGATRTIVLQSKIFHFAGPSFRVVGTLDMSRLAAAAASLAQSAGTSAPPNYAVAVSPLISAKGRLDGRVLHVAFDKPLAFAYTPASSSTSATLTPPGSNQAGSATGTTTSSPSITALSTSATGFVVIPDGKAVGFLGVSVLTARTASILILTASLFVMWLLGRRLLADANSDDETRRIATRHGASLVEVGSVSASSTTAVVDVRSFEGLLQVSRRLECPVLHCPVEGVYAVLDNGTLYRYSCVNSGGSEHESLSNGHVKQPNASARMTREFQPD